MVLLRSRLACLTAGTVVPYVFAIDVSVSPAFTRWTTFTEALRGAGCAVVVRAVALTVRPVSEAGTTSGSALDEAAAAFDPSVQSGVLVVATSSEGARGMMSDWPARNCALALR